MKEKVQKAKKTLCIIGGATVAAGAAFAVYKLCPKCKKGKKK